MNKILKINIDDRIKDNLEQIEKLRKHATIRGTSGYGKTLTVFGSDILYLEGVIEGMKEIKMLVEQLDNNKEVDEE